METVTPVSSNDAQRVQQEIMSEASRAFQILLEILQNELKKGLGKPKETEKETLKDKGKIVRVGKEKDPHQLTWEDYGKLQALSQKDVGDNNPNFADIEVIQLDYEAETPLLATNSQGTLLTNSLKQLPPSEITASTAVSRALNKLADSPTKDYLLAVNQRLTQQLKQQHQLLEESQQINQQLTKQLHQSQSLTLESQKINQQQAKLLQNYQQLQQLRDKKDPQWWSKVGTHLKNKVMEVKNKTRTKFNEKSNTVKNKAVQLWTSLNQWWQNKNQQNEDKQLAGNLRYLAKEMMGTFDEKAKLSGDKYDLEKKGNTYQLKSKQGAVLMKFQDKGVLGTQVIESKLTPEQKEDLKQLGNFRKDSLFFTKNTQFLSNQTSFTASNPTRQSSQQSQGEQNSQDYDYIFTGLKYIVDKIGQDLDNKNVDGFDIKTQEQGKTILISRSDNGNLVASQGGNGNHTIANTSTLNDVQALKQIVTKGVKKVNQSSQSKRSGGHVRKGR